jgi:hypothetical protein
VTLVGAGVTLHACLAAADALGGEGIAARVIDAYSVKPIDSAALAAATTTTGGRIVVAESFHRSHTWCGHRSRNGATVWLTRPRCPRGIDRIPGVLPMDYDRGGMTGDRWCALLCACLDVAEH